MTEQLVGLVTGAASGIGRASARALAAEGRYVAVLDVDQGGGEETAEMIKGAGGDAEFMYCDVADSTSVRTTIESLAAKHGRLDFAHNNAGINIAGYTVDTLPEDVWDRVVGVNLKGVWLSLKHELAIMRQQGSGAIVNTSSVCGIRAIRNASPYTTTKHGIIGLTLEAALDNAALGIRVNAVLPGMVDTPMSQSNGKPPEELGRVAPMLRVGEPEEIASAVCWLLSDAASYVTGHSLVIDGGLTTYHPSPLRPL